MNGAAAHLASPGDLVIVATFAEVDAPDAAAWQPTVVRVDAANRITSDAGVEVPFRRSA